MTLYQHWDQLLFLCCVHDKCVMVGVYVSLEAYFLYMYTFS